MTIHDLQVYIGWIALALWGGIILNRYFTAKQLERIEEQLDELLDRGEGARHER